MNAPSDPDLPGDTNEVPETAHSEDGRARDEILPLAFIDGAGVPPGWQVPWPDPPAPTAAPRRDRHVQILTSAATSATITLLMLWLWGPAQPAGDSRSPTDPAGTASRHLEPAEDGARSHAVATDGPTRIAAAVPAGQPVTGIRQVVDGPQAADPATGFAVVTQPPGASVTINGVGYGRTPIRIKFLPPGPKRIRVTKDGFESEERVVVAPGELRSATMRITLREAPSDARSTSQALELDSQSSANRRLR